MTSRKAECLQILLQYQSERTLKTVQQASCVLQINTLVCLTILVTLTFLNLVTQQVNLFPPVTHPAVLSILTIFRLEALGASMERED